MQRATCTGLRIRSPSDARTLFHAVRLGILPMVTRRLDTEERSLISPGSVYVWEERGPHAELTGVSGRIYPKDNVRLSSARLGSNDGQMVNSFLFPLVAMSYHDHVLQEYAGVHREYERYALRHAFLSRRLIRSKGFLFYHEKQTPQHMYSEYEVAGPLVFLALIFAS